MDGSACNIARERIEADAAAAAARITNRRIDNDDRED